MRLHGPAAMPESVVGLIFKHVYAGLCITPTTACDLFFWRDRVDRMIARWSDRTGGA